MPSAAFFDLDRVVLPAGFTATVMAELDRQDVQLGWSRRPLRLAAHAHARWGEAVPAMVKAVPATLLRSQWVRSLAGVAPSDVQAAAQRAAHRVADRVVPWAGRELARHHDQGSALVLVTAEPHDFVNPLAESLGFDYTIATQLRVAGDGRYDGTVDGEWICGVHKARAVKYWARANYIDLALSAAFSGSVFDLPLLGQVGAPTVVNPDFRLNLMARTAGWLIRWPDTPAGTHKVFGLEPVRALTRIADRWPKPWVDITYHNTDAIPTHGPAVLVWDYRSPLDAALIAAACERRGRAARFVDNTADGVAAATRLLAEDELVVVSHLKTAAGASVCAGVAVLPVQVVGSEKAWPAHRPVPYLLNVANQPSVAVCVGEPVFGNTPTEVEAELLDDFGELLASA